MTKLQEELDNVWKLLSVIPVQGDAVDIMAAARRGLKAAFQMAAPDGGADKEAAPTEGDDLK